MSDQRDRGFGAGPGTAMAALPCAGLSLTGRRAGLAADRAAIDTGALPTTVSDRRFVLSSAAAVSSVSAGQDAGGFR